MYKTITFFRNIEEEKFRKLYLEGLLPLFYNLPGFICTDVTSVSSVMEGDLGSIQYMIEAHFETEEIMNEVLASQEIGEMMQTALKESGGDIFFYTGHTARIYSDNAKKKYNKEDNDGSVLDDYTGDKLLTYDYDTPESKNNNMSTYTKGKLN
ncbi:hypothetical protein MK805_08955 [Shimazuella sp. AN120528]|uniref:hypothetical protein n=1 Tax=Shimazuella soli TaxID=1892854 RepID=UPI001F0F4224|nr:hypothetical protein [Shimazuella soli]MCH5585098.1 hypothetical protein [Shimazuella soli]